jgi:hypothetical protein
MRNSIISLLVSVSMLCCSHTWASQQTAMGSSVKQDLLTKVQADISKVEDALAKASNLTDKVKLSAQLAEFQEVAALLREPGSSVDPARDVDIEISRDVDQLNGREVKSYTQYAGESFNKLVPVYAGDEVEQPVGFGRVYTQAMNLAESERPEIATVKVAVVQRLQEAHTRAVLGQDTLHVPEYSQLLKAAQRSEQVIEVLQAERLKDEATVEALENPGFFGRIWWWWHS